MLGREESDKLSVCLSGYGEFFRATNKSFMSTNTNVQLKYDLCFGKIHQGHLTDNFTATKVDDFRGNMSNRIKHKFLSPN